MATGLTDKLMSFEDIVALMDAAAQHQTGRLSTGKDRVKFQTETLPGRSLRLERQLPPFGPASPPC